MSCGCICVLSQTNSQIVVQIHTKLAFYNCICLKTTKTKQIQCKKFELNQCIFAKIKLNSQFVSNSNCTCHFVQSLFDRMKWDWAHQKSDLYCIIPYKYIGETWKNGCLNVDVASWIKRAVWPAVLHVIHLWLCAVRVSLDTRSSFDLFTRKERLYSCLWK